MSLTLSQIGEFGLIERIRRHIPHHKTVIQGIGDDAAVLDTGGREWLLFTTDMLVEGTHFSRRDRPQDIGHKVMASNISDIAAMGGRPTFAVASLAAPPRTRYAYISKLWSGIRRLARRFDVVVVGGDTVRHTKLAINIALLGQVRKKHLVRRDGARLGDRIFVTGALGGSFESKRHLRFTPRLKEAQWLVSHFKPHAMIDISDGLVADLGHILKASRLGAQIHASEIPRHRGVSLKQALYEGEDFELLFTLPEQQARRLLRVKKNAVRFHPIGRTVRSIAGRMTILDQSGRTVNLKGEGFVHF